MGKYLLAFLWLVGALMLGLFGAFMAYAYTQHGDSRNLIVVAFSGIFTISFASLFLDQFVKAITHSVYSVNRIDKC